MSPLSSPGRRILAALVFLVPLGFLLVRPSAERAHSLQVRSYDPSLLTWSETGDGVRVALPGLSSLEETGRPDLPVDRITFEPPAGTRLAGVSARASGWREIDLPGAPAFHRGSLPALGATVEPDADAYAAEVFPPALAEITAGGFLRGRRLETVTVYPVRWRPERGVLEVATEVVLDLDFQPLESEPVAPRRGPWPDGDRFGEAVTRLTGITPPAREDLAPLVNGSEPFSPRFRPSEDGSAVRYLILCPDDLSGAFQELADWKTALGTPAVVRSLEWVAANYPQGVDGAEDVRNFIREAVTEWGVEYVLLGGDINQVPMRYAKSYFFGGELIPTDLYMTCLDGNWNENGNDLFAEPVFSTIGDKSDLYPDVWVGRAVVRNATEVGTFIDKIKAYETAAPLGSGFSETMLVLGEVLFPQNWTPGTTIQFDGADVAESALVRVSPAISPYRMYENYTAFPGSVPEEKQAVLNQLDVGYNITLHVGHGYRNTMAVGLGGLTLTNGDADGLLNGVRQGLLYAINCTSSALDFDCISEHLLRNPHGGALACIGSTRLDFPETGWLFQNEFFDLLYQDGITRLGAAHALQKLPYVPTSQSDGERRWTQFNLVCLGDPDLDIHTGPLDTLGVSLGAPLELGGGPVLVTVTDGSGPVEGATVALHKVGDAYAVAVTDALGNASLDFDPDLPGNASLGVRAHNHRSRVDSVTVAPPAGAHLFVSELVVDDAAGGDGDGNLEAGETAFLLPTVTNLGGAGVTGATVQVTGTPAGVVLLDGTAAVGTVNAGAAVPAGDPLQVMAAVTVSDLSQLALGVQLDAAGYSRSEDVLLHVGGARIDIRATVRRDTTGNGNGDGLLQANEDQHLRVYLRNRGLGRAYGLSAVLSSSDPAVTISDDTSTYGDLEAGAVEGGDGFLVSFTDTNPTHPFTLTVSDQRGVVFARAFEISPPTAPYNLTASGGADRITLRWTKPAALDLRGYRIYRAPDPGGPFAVINADHTDDISYYADENLPPLTRQYYRVAAVDSSGNQSVVSGTAEATTSLPLASGFPLELGTSTSSSPGLGYFDGDGKAELIIGGNEIYITTAAGLELVDGDKDAQTYGVFSDSGFGPFWSPPSTADLDGDGVPEIASAGWASGQLFVWDARGNVKPGWPRSLNLSALTAPAVWSAPALADLDGDDDLEIVICAANHVFAFHHDGTEVIDGDSDPLTLGVFRTLGAAANYATPAIADVDNDGAPEIIVASRDRKLYVMNPDGTDVPNFPYLTGGEITNSPAVGDLNNDGWKEIVFAGSDFLCHALNVFLAEPTNWPVGVNMNLDYDASPALADMNGDGFLDVILLGGNGAAYIYRGNNGWLFPGWGFTLYDAGGAKVALSSSPVVGNLDADPENEICFGANDGNLYAFNVDATLVDGFPIGTDNRIEGAPLIWDIDQDGLTEVVAQSYDQRMYVWNSPGVFDPNDTPWPMFHKNARRTGEADTEVWVVVGVPETGTLRPALAAGRPNPFRARTTLSFSLPESREAVLLAVYDVRGRLVRTLHDGPAGAGEHQYTWDGADDGGRRLAPGVYFTRLGAGPEAFSRKIVLLP